MIRNRNLYEICDYSVPFLPGGYSSHVMLSILPALNYPEDDMLGQDAQNVLALHLRISWLLQSFLHEKARECIAHCSETLRIKIIFRMKEDVER